ncbi:MAG TPA: hypothetical protein VNQ72_04540 [Candidatus Dormibacteraeota bacterium]|jgi:hypothetical protein|nr:hypothetical protein [Candidatus Dormibacteraeota bacterium]
MKPLDPAARPARPELDVHLTENVPVSMRDGVRLAAPGGGTCSSGARAVDLYITHLVE